MIYYYFDASAWIKRYYREPGTNLIQDLFESGVPRACATLGYVEVLATLSRKRKANQITEESFQEISQTIELDWIEFLQIDLDVEILEQAKSGIREFALRGADAIHLASALVLQSDLRKGNDELVFVTSDQELNAAAESAGLETLDPTETRKAN